MRKLGQTIAKLARHQKRWKALMENARAKRYDNAPATPLIEVTGFGSNPGSLRMLRYVPRNVAPSPALVVVLHGCTQSAASYDAGVGWSTLAEQYGFVLLFPEQIPANNPKTCFNWFLPGDTRRDSGEALSIRQMIEKMIGVHGVDRDRVFVTGLSAGGAMAATMLAIYPEVFAAGAIIAGLPYGTAENVQQAFESMFQGRTHSSREWGDMVRGASRHRGPWPRLSVWHGDADATVVPANADAIIQQWADLHDFDVAAPVQQTVDTYSRKVWRRNGIDVIESFTISGMGHGTPLATANGGCGSAGPFLLDVGISSSLHIADFFGLLDATQKPTRQSVSNISVAPTPQIIDVDVEVIADERVESLGADREPNYGKTPDRGTDVMAVITKALTSAGLMKPPR